MRALAYFGKNDIKFTNDLPEPKITAPDELIIDISWCGICGTDLHEFQDGPIFFPENGCCHEISGEGLPQAMGHEIAGIVSEIGPKVKKFQVGDRVVVEPTGTCKDRYRWPDAPNANQEECAACKKGLYNICSNLGLVGCGVQSGGFAERMVMNEAKCYKIPEHLTMDVAALIQPIAVSWHAVRVSKFKPGSSVLIIGGGPIGLGTILALNGHGVTEVVVSEPAKIRRDLAEKMGAVVYDPMTRDHDESIKYLRSIAPGGDGFDYTFDCSGNPATLKAAIECLTFRGTAVNVAIWGKNPVSFLPMDLTHQEKSYTGSMCYTYHDFEAVIKAFEERRIDEEKAKHMITGRVPIENGVKDAILRLITHKEQTIKIILTPNNNNELGDEPEQKKKSQLIKSKL
ncbi:putative dehydrogenase BDH2 NDAI_0H02060 [Naumovozyma dairenensis CBS 421]|uniref:Enoyl reductase (ER) domain-containing protein n=1 Tax=Naumovozyma dairenensis (strain ATCC 10597 / BCRC 20456 / CBS 421 / NBRC 0211 / NRRL Y-12639) TaxID=1071378 RepID=G0WF19_NAUDC|nr:hypothetical protein NDAI_0H02060 [Naumovozyma dairenensis CBS 421]CCD26380.1 hypothetical protein NDAI_0H02060 [Naumovozyma dairenensis CBS 421]